MFIDFRERGREEEKEEEKHDVREKHLLVASWRHVPWLGIKHATFWFMGRCSKQLSHTGQGFAFAFKVSFEKCTNQTIQIIVERLESADRQK